MERYFDRPSAFPDVRILLDAENGFSGILTPEGIEACTEDSPYLAGRKVLSSYADACGSIRKILRSQLGLDLPQGFLIDIAPEDLALFCSQLCSMEEMDAYLEQKREQTAASAARWRMERPWDTNPMTAEQARAHNFVFEPETGAISTDGCFNGGRRVELPSSIDGARVTTIKTAGFVSYTYLETLVMPDSITDIEPYAFYDKVHLKRANLSNNLRFLPEGLFGRCRSLVSIIIPPSVEDIRAEAFYQCSSLTTVIIPDTVKSVGRCAFLHVPHIYYHGDAKGFPWGATVGN